MKIINLYTGKAVKFGPRGKPSAIDKSPIQQVSVNTLGFEGDEQGDRKVHGGVEKAIHQYALSGYEKLMKRYPIHHKIFKPGSIGENLTTENMSDDTVCIGDIFQVGSCTLQVSSPRIPCWKISHKLDITGLDKFIAENGITGWYFRVLQAGNMAVGDEMIPVKSPNPNLSISRFMYLINHDNTDIAEVKSASEADGLDPEWKARLQKKIQIRLEKNEEYVL